MWEKRVRLTLAPQSWSPNTNLETARAGLLLPSWFDFFRMFTFLSTTGFKLSLAGSHRPGVSKGKDGRQAERSLSSENGTSRNLFQAFRFNSHVERWQCKTQPCLQTSIRAYMFELWDKENVIIDVQRTVLNRSCQAIVLRGTGDWVGSKTFEVCGMTIAILTPHERRTACQGLRGLEKSCAFVNNTN